MAKEAGLTDIILNPKAGYIDRMVDWQDPLYQKIIAALPAGTKPGEYLTSLEITARKPGLALSTESTVRLDVYDPAMCCSTGVCGPDVDRVLVRFAGDLKWLQDQGVKVQRFNLSQSPAAFVENEQVKQALTDRGEAALPMVLTDGRILSTGRYPERHELAAWLGLIQDAPSIYSSSVNELVALGAAIAANCEPCLKYHYHKAQELGVSKADMARAVEMGAKVKDSPHQSILKLADRLTESALSKPSSEPDACCGSQTGTDAPSSGKCCG
jgi:AhpD family alkylhydroperoxidase